MSAVADPELASLALRAHVNLSSLDPVERYRFDGFLYAWLSSFERALIDGRDGEYPEEYLIPMRAAIAGFLRTEGGALLVGGAPDLVQPLWSENNIQHRRSPNDRSQ
jgi:hypothetical protein